MTSRPRTYILVGVRTILGAVLAGPYVVRFMDVQDCKTSFDVACTENFIRLPGIVFSWPVALVIVMTLGALLGAVLGLAISRLAERATP
jgi:ribose/xylose/arabinose/galactoside ABC-type transport system permease subunit